MATSTTTRRSGLGRTVALGAGARKRSVTNDPAAGRAPVSMPAVTISPRRTRLTPEREQEVLAAVLELVREQGYDAVTMDAIAARTRSSKATLYRQWASKPTLVVTALRHCTEVHTADIDNGSLIADLHQLVREIGERAEEITDLMQAMGHAILQDPDLDRAFREMLVQPEIDALHAMVRRAIERGELAAGNPAADYLVHMLLGAMMARPLIDDRSADAEYLSSYLEKVVFPVLNLG